MLIRNASSDPYRSNRWHVADDKGNPICGHTLRAGRRRQTREATDGLSEYAVCAACRKKQAGPQSSVRFTKREAIALHRRAEAAAREAAEGARPTPMIVGEPLDLMGSLTGTDNRIDYDKPVHVVNDGPCGYGWVTITPGNGSFARRIKQYAEELRAERRTLGDPYLGVHRGYYGGMEIWRPGYDGQSYERGMAAARAYAKVLQEAGIQAVPSGRLD